MAPRWPKMAPGWPQDEPKIRTKKSPAKPSKEDIERHNACGHLPYRDWCPICVQGRGKEDGHARQAADQSDLPLFECDYHFMSSSAKTPWSRQAADDPKTQLKLFSIKEKQSKSYFVTVVPSKGISESSAAVDFFMDSIADIGYANSPIRIQNDQEPAIVAVIEALTQRRKAQTLIQQSPVGSSASNGSIESAISEIDAAIRVNRIALEQRMLIKIPIDHPVLPWLVKHTGFVLQRCLIGHDGMSSYQRIHHKPYTSELVEFGEQVHYKYSKTELGPNPHKYDATWNMGILIGIRDRSNEYQICDNTGIHKARTIKRMPENQRWIPHLLNTIADPPWNFKYNSPVEPPAQHQAQPIAADSGERLPQPIAEGESPNDDDDPDDPRGIRDFKISNLIWKIQDSATHQTAKDASRQETKQTKGYTTQNAEKD